MKVLLITNVPVNNGMSVGNTFLNVLPKEIKLANIYTRNGVPDKRVQQAFRINEKMIINTLLGKMKQAGEVVLERDGINSVHNQNEINEGIIKFAQKKRYIIFFWIQELIWGINIWKSKELKNFIEDFNPDIIFTFFINNIFLNRIILHILKISKKPLVLYAWDNNYQWNKYQISPLKWINQCFERFYMRKVMKLAKKVYVISDIQKKDYERIFKKQCAVLTKGMEFSKDIPIKEKYNNPLQVVYTGNIGNNRWQSLAMIANALESINKEGCKGQLKIYTATPLTKEMKTALNKGENSIIMGSVSSDKILEIQQEADILIHVEAFDSENKFLTRHSFSTKIIDYLKMARPILVVGPREIAPVEYFIKNDIGFVITDEKEVINKVEYFIKNFDKIATEQSKKNYIFGKDNHGIEKMQDLVINGFREVLK